MNRIFATVALALSLPTWAMAQTPVALSIPSGIDPGTIANSLLGTVASYVPTILGISVVIVLVLLFKRKILGRGDKGGVSRM